jgi:hypothetical protein
MFLGPSKFSVEFLSLAAFNSLRGVVWSVCFRLFWIANETATQRTVCKGGKAHKMTSVC